MPPRNANWWEGTSIHRLPSKLRAMGIDGMVPFPVWVGACLKHCSAELGARIEAVMRLSPLWLSLNSTKFHVGRVVHTRRQRCTEELVGLQLSVKNCLESVFCFASHLLSNVVWGRWERTWSWQLYMQHVYSLLISDWCVCVCAFTCAYTYVVFRHHPTCFSEMESLTFMKFTELSF